MRAFVVTGASTGIGRATCEELVRRGLRVFGSVRRPEDGARLSADLGAAFTPLLFNVADERAVREAAGQVRAMLEGRTLGGLVNNAGVAVAGPLLHLPLDEFRRQIEINVTGQLAVTQAFGPLLGADRSLAGEPGRIVMISSVSGVTGSPFLGPYVASKHALEGLSESLRRELILYGIDVIVIGPGAIATPIWEKAGEIDVTPYAGTDYAASLDRVKAYMAGVGEAGLPPAKVAALVADALVKPGRKVRYPIVPSPLESFFLRVLPKRMVDRMIAKRLGLAPKP